MKSILWCSHRSLQFFLGILQDRRNVTFVTLKDHIVLFSLASDVAFVKTCTNIYPLVMPRCLPAVKDFTFTPGLEHLCEHVSQVLVWGAAISKNFNVTGFRVRLTSEDFISVITAAAAGSASVRTALPAPFIFWKMKIPYSEFAEKN